MGAPSAPDARRKKNMTTSTPTRRIRVEVTDAASPMKTAAAQLNGAVAATKKSADAEVAAAQAQEGAAARLVEIVIEVEMHVADIMRAVERNGGQIRKATAITEPHDVTAPMPREGYGRAETNFDVFEQKEGR